MFVKEWWKGFCKKVSIKTFCQKFFLFLNFFCFWFCNYDVITPCQINVKLLCFSKTACCRYLLRSWGHPAVSSSSDLTLMRSFVPYKLLVSDSTPQGSLADHIRCSLSSWMWVCKLSLRNIQCFTNILETTDLPTFFHLVGGFIQWEDVISNISAVTCVKPKFYARVIRWIYSKLIASRW